MQPNREQRARFVIGFVSAQIQILRRRRQIGFGRVLRQDEVGEAFVESRRRDLTTFNRRDVSAPGT